MECLVSKESLLPRWWGNETLKFGIKRVDVSNSHRKKITKPMFRSLALRQSESTS